MRASLCTVDATGLPFSCNSSCSQCYVGFTEPEQKASNLRQIGLKMETPDTGVPNPFKETRGVGMVMEGDPFRGEMLALYA